MRGSDTLNAMPTWKWRLNNPVLLGIAAMAVVVATSNVLVQFLLGDWLTWGAFVYPFAFLVTDVMNRAFGARSARRVVAAGFAVGVLFSFAGTFIHGEFGPLVTLRIAMASGIAFLCAQMMDIAIFDRLRQGTWWRAPLVSTLIGSSVDTFLFFGIAFSSELAILEPGNDISWANEVLPLLGVGPEAPLWVSLAVADFFVKLAIALVALGPFRIITVRILAKRVVGEIPGIQ